MAGTVNGVLTVRKAGRAVALTFPGIPATPSLKAERPAISRTVPKLNREALKRPSDEAVCRAWRSAGGVWYETGAYDMLTLIRQAIAKAEGRSL